MSKLRGAVWRCCPPGAPGWLVKLAAIVIVALPCSGGANCADATRLTRHVTMTCERLLLTGETESTSPLGPIPATRRTSPFRVGSSRRALL